MHQDLFEKKTQNNYYLMFVQSTEEISVFMYEFSSKSFIYEYLYLNVYAEPQNKTSGWRN